MSQHHNVIQLSVRHSTSLLHMCLDIDANGDGRPHITPFSDSLCDFIFEFNLTQLILTSMHSKGNILDLLFIDIDHLISNLRTHYSQFQTPSLRCTFITEIADQPSSCNVPTYFLFSKGDYDVFNDYMSTIDYSFCNGR